MLRGHPETAKQTAEVISPFSIDANVFGIEDAVTRQGRTEEHVSPISTRKEGVGDGSPGTIRLGLRRRLGGHEATPPHQQQSIAIAL